MKVRAVLVGLLAALAGTAHAAVFDADLSGEWSFADEGGVCEMRRPLGLYGVVRFVGEPGYGLQLQIVPKRDFFSKGGITALAAAPEWHQSFPREVERGHLRHVSGGVVSASDPVATALLMDLYAGFTVRLEQPTWFSGEAAELSLSPVRFRASYDAFAACYQWLMPANFEDVERTRIAFAPGAAKLSERHKSTLTTVAEYVLKDVRIERIYVDGHTDGSGNERDNMRLSERRARVVADWLVANGVPKDRLVVRFHAARYPVAQGDGKGVDAQNRRATVRLKREDGFAAPEVASK